MQQKIQMQVQACLLGHVHLQLCNAVNTLLAHPYHRQRCMTMTMTAFCRANPSDASGADYQYIISHGSNAGFSSFGPDQVALYMPETSNPLFGAIAVRAMVRGTGDVNRGRPSEVWLDSNGDIGNDLSSTGVYMTVELPADQTQGRQC